MRKLLRRKEARNTPAARMLTQANAAATGINMGDIEANIQAQIQAKVASGASKDEIMASMGNDEVNVG